MFTYVFHYNMNVKERWRKIFVNQKKANEKKISTFIHNLLLQINYQSKINS